MHTNYLVNLDLSFIPNPTWYDAGDHNLSLTEINRDRFGADQTDQHLVFCMICSWSTSFWTGGTMFEAFGAVAVKVPSSLFPLNPCKSVTY